MKKILSILLIALLAVLSLSANGATESKGDSNRLVLITSSADDNLNSVIPAFEEKTGIDVEIITGSTGEVYSRIQAEKENPSCDVTWIGEYYAIMDTSLFETYVSPNDVEYPEQFKNTTGVFTATNGTCPVIIWNKDQVPQGIKGYADLLNPEFKGKIAFGDAGTSSSAYNHLENMLIDFGDGDVESDKAWEFVEALLNQLDGRIVNSSSVTYRGVASGEYAVGLSWDAPALELAAAENNTTGFCYMEEGAASKLSGVCIIKGAKNLENAKAFVDFMSSEEGQSLLAMNSLGANPVRTDVDMPESKAIMKDANIFPVNSIWSADIKESVQTRFTDMLMDVMG